MKNLLGILSTLTLISVFNVCQAAETTMLTIMGNMNENLEIRAEVNYEATRKFLGCGKYVNGQYFLTWRYSTNSEIFTAESDNEGNYSLDIPLKNLPKFGFCKWKISHLSLSVRPKGSIDRINTHYTFYASSGFAGKSYSDITQLSCRPTINYNVPIVKCKTNLDQNDDYVKIENFNFDIFDTNDKRWNLDITLEESVL